MRWAMWHDLPEIRTGDINTAVKTYLKKVCGEDTLKAVEYSYSDEYALIDRTTFSTIKDLVKLADYMEALGFLNIEGKGPHASEVALIIYADMHAHFREAKANSCVYEWDNLLPIMWSLHPGKTMGVTVIKDNAQREVSYG